MNETEDSYFLYNYYIPFLCFTNGVLTKYYDDIIDNNIYIDTIHLFIIQFIILFIFGIILQLSVEPNDWLFILIPKEIFVNEMEEYK